VTGRRAGSVRRLVPYVAREWPALLVIVCLTFLVAAGTALQPWPLKILVDYALQQEPISGELPAAVRAFLGELSPAGLVAAAALASVAVAILSAVAGSALNWAWTVTGQRMVRSLALEVFARLQRVSLLYHHVRPVGDSLTRLTSDTWAVYSVTGAMLSPVTQAVTFVTMGIVAWRLSPELAVLSMASAPLLAVASRYFGHRLKTRARIGIDVEARLTSFVQQTLSAVPLVQAFGTERRNAGRFDEMADVAVAMAQRRASVASAYRVASGLITTTGTAVVLYVGGRQVMAGELTVGSLLVFLAYLRNMQSASEAIIRTYATLKPVEASVERVLEVLDEHEGDVEEAPQPRPLPDTGAGVHVRLENVTFGYEASRPVLRGVTLDAPAGTRVALVGRTGSGKSTLVSLIPRFFDPWDGRILLNGEDARRLRLAELREHVAIVLQEPFLFPGSIAENIAYGRHDAAREEVVEAARAANADAFIRARPGGYDAPIGERGGGLSGGERQRIAIARALLKNAPVLILDEPTAALDAATEASLLDALDRLMEGRPTLLIAHRLSTVREADQVVVLEQGVVVESGPPDELLGTGGAYYRMRALQYAEGQREALA
jgi:ATP-binding cassette, subfamily B, bacterial